MARKDTKIPHKNQFFFRFKAEFSQSLAARHNRIFFSDKRQRSGSRLPTPPSALTHQLIGIENLHFSIVGRTGIRQKTVIVGYAQRTQTVGIRRRISDRVQHLHVADVVDVETLLEADDESRPENVSI